MERITKIIPACFLWASGYRPMLVTLLDCSLSSVTAICIFAYLVYQLTLYPRCVEKILRMGIKIYTELRTVGVVGWNKMPVGTQRQEKLSVNDNQLFIDMKWLKIIYTQYICGNCVASCIWETGKRGILLALSFDDTQFFWKWGSCWRDFRSWRDFFSYSATCIDIRYLLSTNPKNMDFSWWFPGEQTFPIG